jgi:hypothetical protein
LAVSKNAPLLQDYVERQLLDDLRHYGIDPVGLRIDWSDCCGEGKETDFLDGTLEWDSDVGVVDDKGKCIAGGWVDFVHYQDADWSLFVFWDSLTMDREGERIYLRGSGATAPIPPHIWERMPESMKHRFASEHLRVWRQQYDHYKRDWRRDNPVLVDLLERLDREQDHEGP